MTNPVCTPKGSRHYPRGKHQGGMTSNSPVACDCVVELVGLEPTTRALWNVGVSDQLPWSDTYVSDRSRPVQIAGDFVVLADFPGVLMRGAGVRVRPTPLVGHPCLGPLAPIQIAVDVAIVSDRNFLFPGNREPGCGDAVGMRIRCGRPTFRQSGSRINLFGPTAGRRPECGINMRQVQGFPVAAPIRWADHRGARSPSRAADAHRLRL